MTSEEEKTKLYRLWLKYCEKVNFEIMEQADELHELPESLSADFLKIAWKTGPVNWEKALQMTISKTPILTTESCIDILGYKFCNFTKEYDDYVMLSHLLRRFFKYYPPNVDIMEYVMDYASLHFTNEFQKYLAVFFHDCIKGMTKEPIKESIKESIKEPIKEPIEKVSKEAVIMTINNRLRGHYNAPDKYFLHMEDTVEEMYESLMCNHANDKDNMELLLNNFEIPKNFWDLIGNISIPTCLMIFKHPNIKEIPFNFFQKGIQEGFLRHSEKEFLEIAIKLKKLKVNLTKSEDIDTFNYFDDDMKCFFMEKMFKYGQKIR